MLVVRNEQMVQLQQGWRYGWISRLCQHVKAYFPHVVAEFGAAELRATVERTLERAAAAHGYTSERDLMRYLNLAAVYGWDFEDRVECAWMRACLGDTAVTCRSARLERLVQRCIADGQPETESAQGPSAGGTTRRGNAVWRG